MKIKRISYLFLLVPLLFICSCSSNRNNSSSINSESDSSSDIELSNNVNNSEEKDIGIDVILRQDLNFNGIHYVMNPDKKISFDDSYNLLGYFVNACDLEYWMSFDNNPSLVYAVEENSTLVRHHSNESLKNRFELYSIDIPDAIGLKINQIYIYESEAQ